MTTAATTTYDIALRYVMNDQASQGMKQLDASAKQAHRSTSSLTDMIKQAGSVALGFFGLREAKRSFVDFNSTMEQTRISMAGMFMLNEHGTFNENMEKSNALVADLQQRAKMSVGTTQEFASMASMLVQPLTMAHASMKDIGDLTQGAVVGAKAMGVEWQAAARDVDQALRGQYHSVDQFTGKLLGSLGYAGEEGRKKFNAMAIGDRFNVLKGALNSPALKEMAKAQEGSFAGVFSTLEDNLQLLLGKVGLPLFKAITAEIKGWNTWIDKNGARLEEIGKTFSDFMMRAFTTFKGVAGFIVDHKDLLLALAKVWIGMSAGGIIGKTMGNFAGAAGLLGGGATNGIVGALGGATAAFGPFVAAVGAAAAGLYVLVNAIEDGQQRRMKAANYVGQHLGDAATSLVNLDPNAKGFDVRTGRDAFTENLHRASAMRQSLDTLGVMQGGNLDTNALAGKIQEMTAQGREGLAARVGLKVPAFYDQMGPGSRDDFIARELPTIFAKAMTSMPQIFDELAQRSNATAAAIKPSKGNINVNINHIEVASDDPDRFVLDLSETAKRALEAKYGRAGI